MHKILAVATIVRYEYKMQIRRAAAWAAFLVVLLLSMTDNFPSAGNLARLEFLSQPDYFIYRITSIDSLILVLSLMFLISNRFFIDEKTGVKPLMMAAPVEKWQYIMGKGIAGFCFVFTMLCSFLLVCMLLYSIALPVESSFWEVFGITTFFCVCKAVIVSVLPVSLFTALSAMALPVLTDIKLFYLTAGVLFLGNVSYVNSAEAAPFYLVTSGDLIRLIWVHPKWPAIDFVSVGANLLFLLVCGAGSWSLLFTKHGFWRSA